MYQIGGLQLRQFLDILGQSIHFHNLKLQYSIVRRSQETGLKIQKHLIVYYLSYRSILKATRGYWNFICFYCYFNLLQGQCRSIMQDQMLIALSLWSRLQMKISCELPPPDLQTSMTLQKSFQFILQTLSNAVKLSLQMLLV